MRNLANISHYVLGTVDDGYNYFIRIQAFKNFLNFVIHEFNSSGELGIFYI